MSSILVTTDPGVDDVLALTLLDRLAGSDGKICVSTFGNLDFSVTDRNVRDFIAGMPDEWRYAKGAAGPLEGSVERPWADYYHGPDGFCGVRPPETDKVLEPTESTGADRLISLGPLTTPWQMADLLPSRITVMGGAFDARGNETEYAEFNIAMDPLAASLFFKNRRAAAISVVPIDAVQDVFWSIEDIRSIKPKNNNTAWLKDLLITWFNNYQENFVLYDPLAVYLSFEPEAAEWVSSGVDVLLEGPQRGRTVFSEDNPKCEVAMKVVKPKEVSLRILRLIFDV